MNSSRRQFLVSCGRSAAILSAGPLLASCAVQAAASVRGFSETRLSDPLAARILAYASLASSGHNSQPWEVTLLESHHWRIGIPPERRLPAVDPLGRETLISLGAFLENLAQAAAVEGLHAEVKILSDESQCRDMVEVRLTAGASNSPVWLKRMQQRRVVKKGQLATKLRDDDTRWLQSIYPEQLLYFPRGSAEAGRIAQGAVEAMAMQCQRDEVMHEFARWMRFGNAEIEAQRDGLTTAGMEIEGLAGWFLNHFYTPSDVLKPSFRQQTVDLTAELANAGAGWLVLANNGQTPGALIETGRQYQRLFLQLRERNIACHPMSQLLEEAAGQRELAGLLGRETHAQMLLRIGYVDRYPGPVSPRRPVDWFVKG